MKKKTSKTPKAATGKANPRKPFGKDVKMNADAPEVPKAELGAKGGPTPKQARGLQRKGVTAATRKKRNIGRS